MSDKARDRDITVNRRAFHEYHIDERVEAGLVLIGSEVKSLRDGHAPAEGRLRALLRRRALPGRRAHQPVRRRRASSATSPSASASCCSTAARSTSLRGKIKERGLTLIPLRLYWVKGRAKVELGLGRGKKLHDKREAIRERMEKREVDRAMAAGRRRQ